MGLSYQQRTAMTSPPARLIENGHGGDTVTSSSAAQPRSPPFGRTISKSYAFRSDHSLVTVLRHDKTKRFPPDTSSHSYDSGSEADDHGDDDYSEADSEDSEAVLTRLHRFCWAICCCLCRSPHCCYTSDEDERESGDEVDSDKASAVAAASVSEDNARCFSRLRVCREKLAMARTRVRQTLEFAEYGKGSPKRIRMQQPHQYFNMPTT